MADTTVDEEVAEAKPSKLPLIIGVVLALVGGGGGFFAVSSGLLGIGGGSHAEEGAATDGHAGDGEGEAAGSEVPLEPLGNVSFVEVPPLVVSLGPSAQAEHLRFRASLEVPTEYMEEVTRILPRVQDVLNSYLRALEPEDIEAPGALVKLRSQMLRRVKLVAGDGRVKDLLVLEFVLN